MTQYLYTIFCQKCGWSRDLGQAGMDVNLFCRIGLGAAKIGCEQCGERKTFIKNKEEELRP